MKSTRAFPMLAIAFAASLMSVPTSAPAQDDGFYRGKAVTRVVGYSAGGGYDQYARVLAGLEAGQAVWQNLRVLNQIGVTRGTAF